MRGWKDGQGLSNKHRVNMRNQASSKVRGMVEHSSDSSLTVSLEASVPIREQSEREEYQQSQTGMIAQFGRQGS